MDRDQYAVPPGDHAVLLDAIGRATGLDHPFQEHAAAPEPADGASVRVLGGVIDRRADRVAWVERYHFRPEGYWVDGYVSAWLNLAGKGTAGLPAVEGWAYREPKPQVSVSLVQDRADRVTGVEFMRFFDSPLDCVVVVYDWAGDHKRLCRLTLRSPGLRGVQSDWIRLGGLTAVVIDGEHRWSEPTLWYMRGSFIRDEELMYGLRLPSLTPVAPVTTPRLDPNAKYGYASLSAGPSGTVRWTEQLAGDADDWSQGCAVELRLPGPDQGGIVDDPNPLWDRLRLALAGGAPPDGPDILIGALTVPFWSSGGTTSSGCWEVSEGPWWFPAAWYHFLRTPTADGGAGRPADAVVWLRWLDSLGAQDDASQNRSGWDPAWHRDEGAARFALSHIRRQAAVLAAACRAGKMPVIGDFGAWRKPPVLAPPGFARAWRELPERFRSGW